MRKTLVALTAVVALAVGCHAQVPPTTHSVALTWQAPVPVSGGIWQTPCGTASGSSPCTYILSRISVAAGATGCPVPSGVITYTPLNSSSPATGLTYTDSSAAGAVCYLAQAVQLGTTGNPSNTTGPLTVPANPGAPTLGNGTVAKLDQPQPAVLPSGRADAPPVVAKLEGKVN
jgi:hypothetical protein